MISAISTQLHNRLSSIARMRGALALAALAVLLGAVAWSAYQLMPRHYALRITGGAITSNRHFLAKGLQREAATNGVTLELHPTAGSEEALALVASGQLDLAFIQGGLDLPNPNVVHVATVSPELLHLLARPGITDLSGLRGKRVNLGSRKGGTRVIAKQLLSYAGLREDIDYVESNMSTEELLSLRTDRLPEVLAITSFAPSDVVEYLVRRHGYTMLEVPFPAAFAQRYDWAADSRVLAYTYQVAPAVPPRDIRTIGVNLCLVANRQVDRRAIVKVLESLFSARLGARLKLHLDEEKILASASYPPAEGTRLFMERNRPLLSGAALDKFKAALGLLVSLVSSALVVFKWFKPAPPSADAPTDGDLAFIGYLEQLADLEAIAGDRLAQGTLQAHEMDDLDAKLAALKLAAMGGVGKSPLNDKQLPHSLLLALADARARLDSMRIKQSLHTS